MITLEEILHKYKFLPADKQLLLKRVTNGRAYSLEGYKAYGDLVSLIYDLGNITGLNVGEMVERLDQIEYEV